MNMWWERIPLARALKEKTDDCAQSIIYALKSRAGGGDYWKNEKRVGVKAIRGADGLGWFSEIETGDNAGAWPEINTKNSQLQAHDSDTWKVQKAADYGGWRALDVPLFKYGAQTHSLFASTIASNEITEIERKGKMIRISGNKSSLQRIILNPTHGLQFFIKLLSFFDTQPQFFIIM